MRWCPSHTGTIGNEKADFPAKAAFIDPSPRLLMIIARVKLLVKESYEKVEAKYWVKNAPSWYKELQIGPNIKATKKLAKLNPRSLGCLLVAHSIHGDYYRRFEHKDTRLACSCWIEKPPIYFLYCILDHRRGRITGGPTRINGKIQWALGTHTGAFWLYKQ